MKNIKLKTMLAAMLVLVASACTGDFEELNTNPNQPTTVPTAYLMTNAQRSFIGAFNTTGALYAQHWAETQYTNTSRYETEEASFNGYYTGVLADLQNIIDLNTDESTRSTAAASGSNDNQIAVARILKVLVFQYVTDIWGDIPYSDALGGVGTIAPVYDSQETIYDSFVTELTEAAAQIDENADGMEGDIIFSGDMAAWRLFANSLKLRIGMRMSEAAPAAAQAAVTSALSGGVFNSNDDNAIYAYLSDAANDNPLFAHFLTRTDYAISNVMADFLTASNDPRLNVFADNAPSSGTVVGMPYGVSEAVAGSITNDDISFPGSAIRQATTPAILMSHAEVLFLRAEAIARGWATGDAEQTYNDAIRSSMEYYGVATADIDNFLTEPSVAYDAANYRKSIGEQKWVALYTVGLEAWTEWRRLDFPALSPAPDAVEGRGIPRRRAYTQSEYDLNGTNVQTAVARQGEDVMSTTVWWDK